MITQSSDTHLSAEEFQLELIRKASIAKRISLVRSLSQTTIKFSRSAIHKVNPELNQDKLNQLFVSHHYGEKLSEQMYEYMKLKRQ